MTERSQLPGHKILKKKSIRTIIDYTLILFETYDFLISILVEILVTFV